MPAGPTSEPSWTALPAVQQAASVGDFATLMRIARTAAGLTLHQAGVLAGYSTSTLSRWESGRRRGFQIAELRRLADVYGIPLRLLGLASSTTGTDADSLAAGRDIGGDDPVRRRDLLAGTAVAATGALLPFGEQALAAHGSADTIEDVLFGRSTAPPLAGNELAAQLAAARADFRDCRYSQLARRLPWLLTAATATREATTEDQSARASGHLAQAYCIATQLLIKLHDDGMAWATSDRAVQAAAASADPLIEAEAARLAATVLRRTHHRDGAQRLILNAAGRLQAQTGLNDTPTATTYARLLAAAAYTAALHDHRDSAWTLLHEAEGAIGRVATDQLGPFNRLEVSVYKISLSRVLGDYGAAVDYARVVNPAHIPTPERRARYWEEVALALYGRGRPSAAFQALLNAERDTPQEVRYRSWAQRLTQDLLATNHRLTLPGIREFAHRVGVA